jgi:cellulose synthase (UDP-forming)
MRKRITSSSTLALSWVLFFAFYLWLASVPLMLLPQYLLAAVLLVGLWVLTRQANRKETLLGRPTQMLRVGIGLLAALLTLRYFFWRTFNTLPTEDPLSMIAGFLLYLAECYGIAIYLLGVFVNIRPHHRQPVPLPADTRKWPTVDVMVPSYNEDADLLEVTLMAATQRQYPQHKVNVYLCDDGGTEYRRNEHPDPEVREGAHKRHLELQELCAHLGVTYLTRSKNEHAKAGNLNAALEHTNGDLILILDADHVPTEDFLINSLGWFLKDPKLFLLQTPHNFLNPDPLEKNLSTFDKMPSENEMFYSVVQPGLDFWGASFFCGSAAVLRRKYLMEIGGISGESITEDAETAMDLHARGYNSAYLGKPMVAGLQPETFSGFVVQRVRWAQGMVQIFMLKNPWGRKLLSLPQKLAYTSSSGFWFFPVARVIFLIAPLFYFFFGLNIYYASLPEVVAYAVPHLFAAWGLSNYLFGKVRWPFISEMYETMQSLFALPGILEVVRRPRAPSFNVTPKGEHLENDFISQLAPPFYWIIGLNVLGFAVAGYRWFHSPLDRDVIVIVGAWASFNLVLLIGALGVLLERRQRRSTPRLDLPVKLPVKIQAATLPPLIEGHMLDVSSGGAALEAYFQFLPVLGPGHRMRLRVRPVDATDFVEVPVEVRTARRIEQGAHRCGYRLGISFEPRTLAERRAVVRLLYGSSRQLQHNLERRRQRLTTWQGFGYLSTIAFRSGFDHIRFALTQRKKERGIT